ncbi:hypothetical protein [Roseinatronobacter alkalisoli]|uniref:VWFA domain-containing protein n=1 Tax=Roseinatronobacter alkalisoli TaxID=3028235 RepID=A0ABT5TEK3_9RHOB|nr:hypothetical protein [Roseinatronobacter sp. HJB301]MDD7973399.1 hypothetical protein [Roseinatronobacter sp. HJB301]
MTKLTTIALSAIFLGAPLAAQDAVSERVAIMVFDASGSMWNRLEGDLTRIEVARDVMSSYFQSRDTTIPLAVIAYGHRQRGSCADIETITPLAQHDGTEIAARLQGLNPQGMTPLTASMAMARDMIPATAESADLILITDGLENCDGDPCALAVDLAAQGIDIRAHVVGFGMTEDDINTLSCLPEHTGGMLFQTNSGVELAEAMNAVSSPEPEPVIIDEPPVEEVVEPDLPEASISGPDTIRAGESFTLQWSVPINDRDIVTIVPMGADEGELGTWSRVGGSATQTDLRAPSDPGMYELRYVLNEGRQTLASAAIEVTTPEASISGPDTIRAGESFTLQWSAPINDRDIVTIVPMGADEGALGTWSRVGSSATQTDLRAPSDPGMYELRYVLDEGRQTLASAAIEVTTPEASISGPDTIRAGESFTLQWSAPINDRDIVTIVPMGADEGALGTWSRVGSSATQTDLRAPSDPGMYELRYVLDEGRQTLASAAIEVTTPEASISGPDTIRAGESFTLQWSEPINDRDIVTIVPMGADEGALGTWSRVGSSATQTDLRAPSDPGMYELRYVLDEGRQTLASAVIEVTSVAIEVTGPDVVRAGDQIRITWSDQVNDRDIVTIVPLGEDEGELDDWARVGQSQLQRDFEAPATTGMYEARYVLDEGRVTLGRHIFEVLDATATLGDDVLLEVPQTAAPGATITITWSGNETGINQRIALARADQALFTWIAAEPAEERSEVTFTLPADPGFYEIRYLDFDTQEALSRATIDVR